MNVLPSGISATAVPAMVTVNVLPGAMEAAVIVTAFPFMVPSAFTTVPVVPVTVTTTFSICCRNNVLPPRYRRRWFDWPRRLR